jgi:predicted nucleotidyltransferase
MSLEAVLVRRKTERRELLERARAFVASMPRELGVVGAVVFGSVARGDFNRWSDVDLLVLLETAPDDPIRRAAALGDRPARVQPIVWTITEAREQVVRRNPIALEAVERGEWLVGSAALVRAGGN